MTDTNEPAARSGLVIASWFSLLVAVMSMSVPYMQFTVGARAIEAMKEFNVESPALAVFKIPSLSVAAVAVVLMLLLVVKELALSDAATKIALNLSAAVLMLIVGAWFALMIGSAFSGMHEGMNFEGIGGAGI